MNTIKEMLNRQAHNVGIKKILMITSVYPGEGTPKSFTPVVHYFTKEWVKMGYDVRELAFYEISTNKMIPVKMPNEEELSRFKRFIDSFRKYNPEETPSTINANKCRHCIYCNLCDKTFENNVY